MSPEERAASSPARSNKVRRKCVAVTQQTCCECERLCNVAQNNIFAGHRDGAATLPRRCPATLPERYRYAVATAGPQALCPGRARARVIRGLRAALGARRPAMYVASA